MAVTDEEIRDAALSEEFLAHYGVLGMHWGQRKAENQPNADYSANQRTRDKEIYGRGGVKRINRQLNSGKTIGTARSVEKTRRDTALGNVKVGKKVGGVSGAVAGAVGANVAISALRTMPARRAGARFVAAVLGKNATAHGIYQALDVTGEALSNTLYGRAVVTAGGAYIGEFFGTKAGAQVASRGYNPNRK